MKDWLWQNALTRPDKIAIISDKVSYSYSELHQIASKLANQLKKTINTLKPKIAVYLPNSIDYLLLIHGLIRLNAIFIPINYQLTNEELKKYLSLTETDLLIYQGSDKIENKIVIDDSINSEHFLAMTKETLFSKTFGKSDIETRAFDFSGRMLNLSDIHSLMFTSGTSGTPKGAIISYDNIFESAINSQKRLGHSEEDRWLLTIPLYHIGGLSIVTRCCIYGITIVITEKFSVKNFIRNVNKFSITLISLVPNMFKWVMDQHEDLKMPSLRLILLGGSSTPTALIQKAEQLELPIAVSYGSTESTSQIATITPPQVYLKPGCVGKPLDNMQVKIIGEQNSQNAPNQIGEIAIFGSSVIKGYVNHSMEFTNDGWFKTGDLGYIDNDGDIFVLQRRKDIIIIGGENVFPVEVENVLSSIGGVNDSLVFGMDDEDWGQVVVAIVEKKDEILSQIILEEKCQNLLAKFKIPSKWLILDSLPRFESGKVNRKKAIELFNKYFDK